MTTPHPFAAPRPDPLVLAPMAELTHAPFRMLVRRLGECDLFCTEMLSSRTLVAQGPERSLFLSADPAETGLIHQLAGSDPAVMAEAARRLADRGVGWVDINMGCAAPLIRRKGEGAALLSDPDRARAVVAAVRQAFAGHLSVKLRIPPPTAPLGLTDFCRQLIDAGAQTLTLHPRLPDEKFKRRARWGLAGPLRAALPVPVVVNGDILNRSDWRACQATAGAGGVMIGRGALIRPWLFRDIRQGAEGPEPDALGLLREIATGLARHLPSECHLARLRLYAAWWSRAHPFGHALFRCLRTADSVDGLLAAAARFLGDAAGG